MYQNINFGRPQVGLLPLKPAILIETHELRGAYCWLGRPDGPHRDAPIERLSGRAPWWILGRSTREKHTVNSCALIESFVLNSHASRWFCWGAYFERSARLESTCWEKRTVDWGTLTEPVGVHQSRDFIYFTTKTNLESKILPCRNTALSFFDTHGRITYPQMSGDSFAQQRREKYNSALASTPYWLIRSGIQYTVLPTTLDSQTSGQNASFCEWTLWPDESTCLIKWWTTRITVTKDETG